MAEHYRYIFSIYDKSLNFSEIILKINSKGHQASVIRSKIINQLEDHKKYANHNILSHFDLNFSNEEIHMYNILINFGCYLIIIKFMGDVSSALIDLLHSYKPISVSAAIDFVEKNYPGLIKNFAISPEKSYRIIENHKKNINKASHGEKLVYIFSKNLAN